jgi:hypothetical protein
MTATAPISEAGMARAMISVERSERRKNHTTSDASKVPSMRCCFSELTMSRMNEASLETIVRVKPGGNCGSISLTSFSWTRSTIATVLALATLMTAMPTVMAPLKRASWRLSVRPSSSSAISLRRTAMPLR